MDTYPVSGCKLLRSCFYLVMQLNQKQFYCSDPIGNLLISFYFTFCLVTVLGSFVSSLLVTFWSCMLFYFPKNPGIRRLQFSAITFFLQSFSWWSVEWTWGAQQFAVLHSLQGWGNLKHPSAMISWAEFPMAAAAGLCCALQRTSLCNSCILQPFQVAAFAVHSL